MRILITGAGSLGEAFVKYLHGKHTLTVIDSHEETIARLTNTYPNVKFILDDFSSWRYAEDPVEYVIHTAAYKHLPLGEKNPNAFIDTNIIKLRELFQEAYAHKCELLFISTDKAVEPCSLYGYSKAIGESLAKHYNFSITRCGNLLNSSGSVIPVWEDCIAKGKPLPLTDPEMLRYYIEVDEAARQMWDWFYLGDKFIIPNMEAPKRLIDLADMVYEKHNIPANKRAITIIGKRPHEKMIEKLRWPEEETCVY